MGATEPVFVTKTDITEALDDVFASMQLWQDGYDDCDNCDGGMDDGG